MVERRAFARWRREPGPGYWPIPADGACLSAFLIVTHPDDPRKVLLGEPDPGADWERIGALASDRLSRIAGHWMLPSSHLLEYESPHEAAQRIAREQLGLPAFRAPEPRVVSEAYGRPDQPGRHWDLHFLFQSAWPAGTSAPASPWRRAEFLDPRTVPVAEFARSHEDILELAGFPVLRERPT
jgi:ADP-ribose pyrophosphatase YjhB (NUDIX family)